MYTRYENNRKQCTQATKTIGNNAHKIRKQYKTMHTRYENK